MSDDFLPARTRRMGMPVLTIAALAAAFALGYWMLTSLRTLEMRGSETDSRVDARLDALEARETALVEAQEKLATQLATLTGSRRDHLFVAEAEHLVRLAAQRLALFQDPQGADALLAAAMNALREVRSVDTHAARAALEQDRARLRDRATFDVESAWLRLATLPERVDRLAAIGTADAAATANANIAPATPVVVDTNALSGWDRFVHGVRSLVVLRRTDTPVSPALVAGERLQAADHFRLLIEQAQLALLQNRNKVYHATLTQAGAQLERITTGDPLLRARVQQDLNALGAMSANPLPTLDASLATCQSLAARLAKIVEAAP